MQNLSCGLPLLLLIRTTLQLLLITTVACYGDENDLILLPFNPEVEDGHELTLNCTITLEYRGNYTNRDIYFRWANVNYTGITLVGSRTALLRRRWNVSEGGHIRCVLPDRQHRLSAIQHVVVVRRPLQPNVTHCLIWNWKDVNCTWEPSVSQQQHHMHTDTPLSQTVEWKLSNEPNDVWQDAACRGHVTSSCVWNISHVVSRVIEAESCCIRVLGVISLHHLDFDVRSQPFCFRPVDVIMLSEPQNVTTDLKNAHQIYVHWQAPQLNPNHIHDDLVYAVTVMSQWSEMPVINVSVMNHSLLFTLVPHTRYTITVKVRTNESLLWSKPVYHVFTSESTKPKMSPPSLSNAFSVTHVDRYSRTVIVYWQTLPPQDRHGETLSYIVQMRKPPALHWSELSVVPSANQPCKDVVVDTESAVELSVIARNEVGKTSPDVIMHLPAVESSEASASPFVKLVVERTKTSLVVWSWQLQLSEHVANLTLFWCRSRPLYGRCVGDFQWLDVAASETERSVSIGTVDTEDYGYGAAIKLDSISNTNGIEWVTCLYDMTGLADPVHNVKAVMPSYGEPGQLLVTWVHPPCDVNHGYIQLLRLQYCQYADTGCSEEPSNISLPGYLTAYNLTGLKHGVEYGVWLYSQTRVGQSSTHSAIAFAATSAPVLTPAVIAGLAVCGLIVLILTTVVIWMLCKYCRRCHNKLWPPVVITVPPERPRSDTTTSTSPPLLEYTRISYTRQGSRLSSSSHDSGQFGIAGGSPLMSPKSCSESVVHPLIGSDVEHQRQPSPMSRSRPTTRTYMNDGVADVRRPTGNSHHRPLSSGSGGHAECIELRPMIPRETHDTSAGLSAAAAPDKDDGVDVLNVTNNQTNTRPNGGYNLVALQPDTDYIPHERLLNQLHTA